MISIFVSGFKVADLEVNLPPWTLYEVSANDEGKLLAFSKQGLKELRTSDRGISKYCSLAITSFQ